jgi:ketohexokinase
VHSEFLGTLSDSMELDFITKDFKNQGVSTENCPIIPDSQFPTSMVILNSQNGSRTILHHATSLPEINLEHFANIIPENYSWIHFEVIVDEFNCINCPLKCISGYREGATML